MRLLSELDREPLAAQFVPVKIETGNNEHWREWSRKYQHEGNAIPIVYVVRADGEQLYGRSGMPGPLTPFLALHLRQAGRMLSPRELSQLAEHAATAQKLVDAGQIDKAAALLARHAGSGSYAEAAVTIDQLAAELAEQGREALSAAEQQLEDDESKFEGGLAFAEVERVYGRLAPVGEALRPLRAKYRRDRELRELLEQTALLDKARASEAAEEFRQALSAYGVVQSRFAGSRAAELAAEGISRLEEAGLTADAPRTASTAATRDGPPPALDERRAAAQLKMARTLLERNPQRAEEYLRKVIELAPESEAAAEARELLPKK